MTQEQIEKKKKELDDILKGADAAARFKKLETLAKEVGASVTRMEKVQKGHDAARVYYEEQNTITETEIVHNIQESLQTHVMINMGKTAARNFWIAVISAATALLAMSAAWAAVVARIGCSQ